MSVSRDWQLVSLESVAQIVNGGTPASGDAEYWDGDIWWLTPRDMGQMRNREIAQTPRTITSAGLRNSSARLVPENSIILSTRAPIGHLAINTQPMAFNQGCRGIVPSDRLDHQFLFYFLLASRSRLDSLGTGATFKELSAGALKSFEVPLPPLDEQKRIVTVLDQTFMALECARANAEASGEDARALLAAELQRQFETAGQRAGLLTFDAVCESKTPRVKLKRQDYLEEGRYPVVSQEADLISGYWDDPAALMGVEGPVVVFGDHTCCLKYVDFDFVVGADGTKVLQPTHGISAKYLYYGLRSQRIQQTGYARHFKLLRETALPDLPMSEQARITDHLGQLEAHCSELADAYEAKLAGIAALRQSLLQAAFSGRL